MSIRGEDIRNIAVIGHSGEGKTSVCEAILFNGKATDRLGKVTEGNTVTDSDEQEIARKMSISLSAAYAMWEGVKLNLLDVPGFYDFEGEENEALRAAGGALLVTGATGAVSVGAEKAIDKCLKNKIPMVIFINGMDKENADYKGTVAALKEKYPGKIAPIQIPLMEGNKMVGYVNALKETCYHFADEAKKQPVPIPEELKGTLAEMQASLTETAAELLEGAAQPRVLDLCAGTGCLGLGVKALRPDARVTCLEKSPEALPYLRLNARCALSGALDAAPGGMEDLLEPDAFDEAALCEKLGLPAFAPPAVEVVEGDLFTYWQTLPAGQLDLIVSNPPYLTAEEMTQLQPETAREPAMALAAGPDGLDFYRALAAHYRDALRPGGALVLEIGWRQREAVTALLAACGWTDIVCRKDYGGNDRCIAARAPGSG